MNYELNYQQKLVVDQLIDGLKQSEEANDSLEAKGAKLMAASTSVIAAISGIGVLPKVMVPLSATEAVFMAILCTSSFVMICLYGKLAGPCPTSASGSTDVNVLFDKYIAKEPEVAFNQWMINAAERLNISVFVNKAKGGVLRTMYQLLKVQIVLLGVWALVKAVC